MSFLDMVSRARAVLREQGRVSLRALKREFGLDDDTLAELVDELVDIQQVAARGEGVLSWVAAAEAERRQLTVMFCDLVGSTRLAAGMDAEDWREVVRGYQTAAAGVIERFGGHVAQYLGDGLLVYFGWPKAHEDDAERAVRAGLGVVEAVGRLRSGLAVRIGIHTGTVVVGEIGSGARRETLALGDTTNVAARLQEAAPPDGVVLSAATLRLVQGVFRIEELGERRLKGIDTPVRTYRALAPTGVRSRLDVVTAAELTPLVGRDQERLLLADRWQQATEGRGQALLIAGEAGIGKSRLLQAFREQLAEQPHTWLECRASPYDQDSPLFTVLELTRLGLGLRPGDTADERLAKLEQGLEVAGLALAEAVPSLAVLLGIPLPPERYTPPNLSPEGLRKKTLALLAEWVLRLGRLQPLVLVVEDLHWLDPSTTEFLGSVLEQVAREPILLLLTHRPDFESPWGAHGHLTPVLLSRLTRTQVEALVRGAARARELPERSLAEIALRSDGVPLFAEELTRAVADGSAEAGEALHIPETLQDSLMARLDALGPVKELAQLASVLGREFDYELLLAVSSMTASELEAPLAAAAREELFYRRGAPPEATYLFKHALIRDAAYASMLRATRQRHHRRVAETLIARMPEVAETQPERVAHHLGEAGDAARAIEWWVRAGERAASRADYAEAVAVARRGLTLVPDLSDAEARREAELSLLMVCGSALTASRGFGHDECRQTWERAYALADPRADPRRAGVIRYYLNTVYAGTSAWDGLWGRTQEIIEIAGRSGDRGLERAAHYHRGNGFLIGGRLAESLESHAAAVLRPGDERPERMGHLEYPEILAWGWLAWVQVLAGFLDRSRASVAAGLECARAIDDAFSVCFVTALGAFAAVWRREWDTARRLGDEAGRVGREQGFRFLAPLGDMAAARAEAEAGDAGAIDRYLHAAGEMAATGNRGGSLFIGSFVDALRAVGRLDEALTQAEGVLGIARECHEQIFLAEGHRLKGEILLALGGPGAVQAEALFREAIDVARTQGAKLLELRAAVALARLWRDRGERTEARHLLRPVYDWFSEGFDAPDLQDARALLAELG